MFTTASLAHLRQTSESHRAFLAVTLCAFLAALLLSAKFLERWTTQTNHRVQAVAALGPQTRALVVGSSHVFASINPARMRLPTMNLAAPVCSYVCMEGIVRGNLDKVPRLSALVLEYDPVTAFYDTLRAYHGDNRQLLELDPDIGSMQVSLWQKYELWRDRSLERSLLGPLFRFGKLTPEVGLRRYRGELTEEDAVVGPGYANAQELMPPNDDGPARVARHVREAAGPSELPRNEAALRRLLQLGASRGVKLAMIRLPHHPGYWSALPPGWRDALDGMLARVQNDFPNVPYWDLGTLHELTEGDYRNGDHVNDAAATKVTALFEQRLSELLGHTEGGASTLPHQ